MRGQGLAPVFGVEAVQPFHILLARHQGTDRVEPQPVVVVEILVAQRESPDPLPEQFRNRVLHQVLGSQITKAPRQPIDQPEATVELAQKERPAIATEISTSKIGSHLSASEALKLENLLGTLFLGGVPHGC